MRHVSATELVTASTDSSLRLWPLNRPASKSGAGASTAGTASDAGATTGSWQSLSTSLLALGTSDFESGELGPGSSSLLPCKPWEAPCSLTYRGHTNERNFVGLSVSASGYIACGSETNTVYCYYKVRLYLIVLF